MSGTDAGRSWRERVARAIAEAAGDGVFDRDEPDCTTDDEDRAYWLRLADAALAASGGSEFEWMSCMKCDGKPIIAGTGHCRPCLPEHPATRTTLHTRYMGHCLVDGKPVRREDCSCATGPTS